MRTALTSRLSSGAMSTGVVQLVLVRTAWKTTISSTSRHFYASSRIEILPGAWIADFSVLIPEGVVELTEEREHTLGRTILTFRGQSGSNRSTLADPDQVRTSTRFGSANYFVAGYSHLGSGKHVVVVGSNFLQSCSSLGHHCVPARRLSAGIVKSKRTNFQVGPRRISCISTNVYRIPSSSRRK